MTERKCKSSFSQGAGNILFHLGADHPGRVASCLYTYLHSSGYIMSNKKLKMDRTVYITILHQNTITDIHDGCLKHQKD